MVAEAEAAAAAGVCPRAPLWAQPPSVTEWSTDLHYWSPSSFAGRGGEALGVCGPSLGLPCRVRTAPRLGCPGSPPGPPSFSPLRPASLGSQALRLPQVFSRCSLLQPGSHPWGGWRLPASPVGHLPPFPRTPEMVLSWPCLWPLPGLLPPSHVALLGSCPRPEGGLCPLPLAPGHPGPAPQATPLPLAPGRRLPIIPESPPPQVYRSRPLLSAAVEGFNFAHFGVTVASLYVK